MTWTGFAILCERGDTPAVAVRALRLCTARNTTTTTMDAQQPRQANRVRLHASDYYFLVLMGVCAASVIMNWSDYDRCQDPMHVRAHWCTLLCRARSLMYTLCAQHLNGVRPRGVANGLC